MLMVLLLVICRARADAEKALAQMSGAMLGSRRIRCGWAQHKQETSSASYVAVDRVRTSLSASLLCICVSRFAVTAFQHRNASS